MAKQIWLQEETTEKIKSFLVKSYGKPAIENRSVANIVEYGIDKLLDKAQQETFPEALANQCDSITSIEMAKNIADELFEIPTVRDTINELAQNFQDSLEAEKK